MRVVRTVAGLVLLTIGLPVLLVGGALWTLMQHRDAGGAFSGSLEPVSTSGRAIVVPDVDALLRENAPFVRAGDTAMRLTVREGSGPVFLGLAPAAAVRDYLAGADYTRVDALTVGRGALPVRLTPVGATGAPGPAASDAAPGTQSFWTRQGSGTIDFTAGELDGREMSLVVMRVDAAPGLTVDLRASSRSGWLPPTAWSLLVLGVLLLSSAIAALVWPVRTREVVFVVDPSQVPQVSARLAAATTGEATPAGPPPVWPALPAGEVPPPVPVLPGAERPADGSWPDWPSDNTTPGRPATLADALAGAGVAVPAPSGPAWPPAQPGPSAAWPPASEGASTWSRAEAARLAGLPGVSAVAAQLSVEAVPTSGAPSGSATALPIPTTRPADATPRPRTETEGDSDTRTPAQRSAGSDGEGGVPAKVAHLRSVPSEDAAPPAKRTARTAAKKRPVVFVDTATEPTGESPDRPIVPTRSRAARGTRTAPKRTPQPREATSPTEPMEATTDSAGSGVVEAVEGGAAGMAPDAAAAQAGASGSVGAVADSALAASVASAMDANGSVGAVADSALAASAASAMDANGSAGKLTESAPGRHALEIDTRPATEAGPARTAAKAATTRRASGPARKSLLDEPAEEATAATDAVGMPSGSAETAPTTAANATTATTGQLEPDASAPATTAKGSRRGAATKAARIGSVEAAAATAARSESVETAVVKAVTAGSVEGAAATAARSEPVDSAVAAAGRIGSVEGAAAAAARGESVETAVVEAGRIGSVEGAAATAVRSEPVDSAVAEATTTGTEVIESTGSDRDDTTAAHGPAAAGAPVGTGAEVSTSGAEEGVKGPARRATRAKKATDPAAPKATRAPRRKAGPTEEPSAETADKPAETATPLTATTKPPRRRKTAAGLPAPETTEAGPAHTAVAALGAKRPTTRRPATKATTKRQAPASDNRATPTDQAS
ncbi:hypothetical protein AB0J74_32080 [Asanoa sp. NPDC049573]|uniref:hypothetical protein n=1 Tax=Asanoa sp. NPDC049573 TaxID=3155396 RepID=UPI00344899FF